MPIAIQNSTSDKIRIAKSLDASLDEGALAKRFGVDKAYVRTALNRQRFKAKPVRLR